MPTLLPLFPLPLLLLDHRRRGRTRTGAGASGDGETTFVYQDRGAVAVTLRATYLSFNRVIP